jgi:hypothetical protein
MKEAWLPNKGFLAVFSALSAFVYAPLSLAETRSDVASAHTTCNPNYSTGQNLNDLRETFIPSGVIFKQAAPRVTLVGHREGMLFFVRDNWICRLTTGKKGTVVSVEKVR